jgi:hypothetical protein
VKDGVRALVSQHLASALPRFYFQKCQGPCKSDAASVASKLNVCVLELLHPDKLRPEALKDLYSTLFCVSDDGLSAKDPSHTGLDHHRIELVELIRVRVAPDPCFHGECSLWLMAGTH